jgi:acyl-CoA synthetase (AMP-forming)/AMP-acid ligase II
MSSAAAAAPASPTPDPARCSPGRSVSPPPFVLPLALLLALAAVFSAFLPSPFSIMSDELLPRLQASLAELPAAAEQLWARTPKKLLAIAGAAAAGVAVDRSLLLTSDLRRYGTLALALLQSKRLVRAGKLVPDVFEDAVRAWPQKPCMQFEGRTLTFAQADAAANRVAHWAMALGLRRGDTVGLLMENRPEFVTVWLGLSKVGVVAALLNTHLQADGLVHCVQVAGAAHLIVGAELAPKLAEVADRLPGMTFHVYADGNGGSERVPPLPTEVAGIAQSLDAQLADVSADPPPASTRRELTSADMALLIYTSGTTGLPKAARVNHFSIMLRALAFRHAMRLSKHDRVYCALPLYHTSGGNLAVGMMLFSGATLCLSRRFSTSKFWDEVRAFDCTVVQYIGEMCRYLLNAPPRSNDRQNHVRAAFGNGLRPDVWAPFQARFGIPAVYEFYGSTEGILGMVNPCTTVEDQGHLGKRGFIVNRVTGTRIVRYDVENDELVRDARGFLQDVGVEEPGELVYRVNQKDTVRAFQGYYRNERESAKKVLTDAFAKGDAYFRTGDLLKVDANACWHFVDRVGDTFRWKGENVSTNEVAETLAKFPGLSDVCVYGVAVPGTEGRACMAAMVFDDVEAFDMRVFAAFVQKQLPAYAAPLFLRQLSEMSVTGTMKHEKAKLRKQGADPTEVTDRMWGLDRAASTYEPLTPELYHAMVTTSRL